MRNLTNNETARLCQLGCQSTDWHRVTVSDPFDADRFRNVTFVGDVRLGRFDAVAALADGVQVPSGVRNAVVANSNIGDNCYISNVGLLSGYEVGSGVQIDSCGRIAADASATFGIGVEVAAVNESGCRALPLSAHLTANIAYLMVAHRYKTGMVAQYAKLVEAEAEAVRGHATIADGAKIVGCGLIENVVIGGGAMLSHAQRLQNGTILSQADYPAVVGAGVIAQDFIVAEGARLTDNAIIKKCFVGQSSQVANGFFAEDCLIFSNCQLFNGEAVAAFAGPFTVSHHKTTLLIASYYSFFNAGSATNASNHHYKLGPAHQAVLDRGVKTGSGSYLLEPAHVGAYSMVVGSHKGHPDTQMFPFSYLIDRNGDSYLLIAQNMKSIGLFRDEDKWRKRDARNAQFARDLYTVEAFNPFTIGTMAEAAQWMRHTAESTKADTVLHQGVKIQRALLPRAERAYRQMVEAYVVEGLLDIVMKGEDISPAGGKWADVGGLLMPKHRMDELETAIEKGRFGSVRAIGEAVADIARCYEADRLAWCAQMAEEIMGLSPKSPAEELCNAARKLLSAYADIRQAIEADAAKEFGGRLGTGYGLDNDGPTSANDEYDLLKGTPETNSAVQQSNAFYEARKAVANEFIINFGK